MTQKFEFHETKINNLIEVTPFHADDERGWFIKDYSDEIFKANGIEYRLLETFYSYSIKGVIRGLHFQNVKQQAKLIRCISGSIYDVVVDLRKDSSTFKKYLSFDLTGENRKEILVPIGCAHGFMALETSIVSYKCDQCFCAEYDSGIRFDDPELGIDWKIDRIGGANNIIISEKDRNLQSFRSYINLQL